MSRKIVWEEIEWNKANCRGIATDLFFEEEENLEVVKVNRQMLRKVCFACPIRQECLMWAFADKDRWAFMGGTTARERRFIENGNYDNHWVIGLRDACEKFAVPFSDVIEASKVERVRDEYTYTDRG